MKKLSLLLITIIMSQSINAQIAPPNGYKWQSVWGLSDEFSSFNKNKWYNYHPWWQGRLPSKFRRNGNNGNHPGVFISNGKLGLRSTLHKKPWEVNNRFKDHWVNSAAVVSKNKAAGPGMYFECKMKASNLSMTSSWWFRVGSFSEIDVIEHIGNPSNRQKGYLEYQYDANTHYYGKYSGTAPKPAKWKMPHRGRDRFHTLGMYWRKDGKQLKFYYNGRHVMTLWPRKPLTERLHMIFDTEVFPFQTAGVANIGLPRVNHLQNNNWNTFYVDYVRSWKLVKNGSKEFNPEEIVAVENSKELVALSNPITDSFVQINGTSNPDATVFNLQGAATPCRITTGADENSIVVEFEDTVATGIYILKTADGKSLKLIKK